MTAPARRHLLRTAEIARRMLNQPEIWKPIPGYEGLFEASSWGRIKALARRVEIGLGRKARLDPEHIFTQLNNRDTDGYRKVNISLRGKRISLAIHRVVCAAFHGPKPTPKHEAGHRDGNKNNNTPSNLAWLTRKQNAEDAARLGEIPRGEQQRQAILTEKQVLEIVQRLAKATGHERGLNKLIGRDYGVSAEVICGVAVGRSWRWLTGIKPQARLPHGKARRSLSEVVAEVRRAVRTGGLNTVWP